MVAAGGVALVDLFDLGFSADGNAPRTGLQLAVGRLVQLGIQEGGEGHRGGGIAFLAAVIVLSLSVAVVIQDGIGIGHRKLAALPVLPDHDLDFAAQVQIPDPFIDPGHVDAFGRSQPLHPDAPVAFFLPEGWLRCFIFIGSVGADHVGNLVNFVPGVKPDGIGADQPVAGEVAGHIDQEKLAGARLVIGLVFLAVPLDQTGGAEQIPDHMPFRKDVHMLGKLVYHQGQFVRRLHLFQVFGFHISADQDVPGFDLCGGFGEEGTGVAFHVGPAVPQLFDDAKALGKVGHLPDDL